MKKFITNIPLQGKGQLIPAYYQAVGNAKLQMEVPVCFPILAAINGYVSPGECFQVIAVQADSEDGRRNFAAFSQELDALCQQKEIHCEKIEVVPGPADERVASHMETFQKLIDFVGDDDELFACITYGTKPMSMAVLMAVQYAYRLKSNTSISCIVYGQVDRSVSPPKAFVYDETALVQMGEIIRVLAERGVSDPKRVIDGILAL